MKKTVTAIGFILLLGAIVFLFFVFSKNLLQTDPSISAAIIGVIGLLGAGIWSNYSTRNREINSRHFLEKKEAYLKFIDAMFNALQLEKSKDEPSKRDNEKNKLKMLDQLLISFKKELIIWGSQDVIAAMQTFQDNSSLANKDTQDKHQDILFIVDDLLRAMRKDLGHNDYCMKRGAICAMVLTAEDRRKLLSK
jgi:hypothetical protein